MLDRVIRWSLANRVITVCAAAVVLALGGLAAATLPVDVFPDLTAPTVTVLAEAHGMAAEEVESLVTLPIESAVNGAIGVRRVRSSSMHGIGVVWVEFDWETDVYRARQAVSERLQLLATELPEGVDPPVMAPITSIMGEIMLVGLSSDTLDAMAVRSAADFQVRRRLLSIPGVAQVIPIGGDIRQYKALVRPEALLAYDVTLKEVLEAVSESNQNASGGIFTDSGREILIRGIGQARDIDDIGATVIALRGGVPVRVRDVARIEKGSRPRFGAASLSARPAVVLTIHKHPGVNTLRLTERIDDELKSMQQTLPAGIVVNRGVFRQSEFIALAVANVVNALRDGAMLVILVLFLFLWNARATAISVVAIPLSLGVALLVMKAAGFAINTMTLGGMAIAIGALVDDAIIDVENVFRRLREGGARPVRAIVYEASREIRGPILNATLIICVVFLPFFFLGGVEGRLLRPLGFAYVISILASLVVAVTVTPALCSVLLPGVALRESWLATRFSSWYRPVLQAALRNKGIVLVTAALLLAGALSVAPFLGRGFLPPFQEGSLVAIAITAPGSSLEESDAMGRHVETLMLAHPAVLATSRRTGRAALDEHVQGVNAAEIDIRLDLSEWAIADVLRDLREGVSRVPGMVISFGQPIGHRIDHMLSGSRSALVIKLFGPNLRELRRNAEEIRQALLPVPGLVDLSVEQQADVPQLRLWANRRAMARFGVRPGDLADFVEAAIAGKVVSQIREGQEVYDLVVRFPEERRESVEDIRTALVTTAQGARVELGQLADVRMGRGPNMISRENVQRLIVVSANVAGRDTGSTIAEIRRRLADLPLPEGYYIVYGGQFESANQAIQTLSLLSIVSLLVIFLILFKAFSSARAALLVLVNLPLALTGGVLALLLSGGELNVAALVGFITLFGIAVRNGLLLVSHYQSLQAAGASLFDAVVLGSMERLHPILMTALTAALALAPLALGGGEPGKEIQTPMAIVILGGLLTSTLLNMVVVPVLYERYMRGGNHSLEKSR